MKTLLAVALAICSYMANATTYYVANSGNDSNSGTSVFDPWQSLAKLNSFHSFKPGDNILFKRGDTFYGTLTVATSGSAGSPITYGAYGTGANPVITGFTTVSSWTNLGSNIWESTNAVSSLSTCNMVVVNGVNTPMGRYPNTGWRTIGSSTVNSITDNTLDATDWTGGEVVIKMLTYVVNKFTITSQASKTLNFTNSNYTPPVGAGYFIQNDKRTLDTQNEWYYNSSTKKLDVYSTSQPSDIKASTNEVLVDIHLKDYITFDGLDFEGANNKAFFIGSSDNIIIQNCNFNNTGWTAIYGENYAANNYSDNLIVQNCSFNDNPQGIKTDSYFHGAQITNNSFKNTGLVYGSWTNEEVQASAIISRGDNSIIEYNRIDSTGYIGIYFTGDNVVIRYNYLTNALMTLDDGGAIYTVGFPPGNGRKVYNNIVLNNAGTSSGNSGNGVIAYGIYMDDYSNDVEIFNNTVANCADGGIYIHNANNMNIHNNLCYDNDNNGGIVLDGNGTYLRNVKVNANILVAKTSDQRTATYKSSPGNHIGSFGTIDNNYYARPVDGNSNIDAVYDYADHPMNLVGWQTFSTQDARSFETSKITPSSDSLTFFYNATKSSITLSLPNKYIDVKNNSYPGSVILAPYSSIVLINNGPIIINVPPTATTGSDQTITLPTDSISLNGSGNDEDGTIASYQWTKISGPNSGAINNANSSSATVNSLSEGTYQFELKVTDNKGAIAKDTVMVKVNPAANIPPTATTGSDQTITLPTDSISLNGSGNDEDGTIASYQWTKISGPNSGAINNANSSSATVNSLSEGTYQFELKVTDNKGAIAKDTVMVKVNPAANIPPTATTGTDQTITLPTDSISLNGNGTDEDGTITSYQWTKILGPLSFTIEDQKSATTEVSNLSEGTYQFEFKVTDDKGAIGKDTVQVKVNEAANISPTVNAGKDQTITLPRNAVTFSASANDEDGTIASYQWTKISGPNSGAINNANSSSATVNNLSEGTYQFEFKVTDDKGAIGKDTVQVKVNEAANISPTVNAGKDQTITLPRNAVTFFASANDEDGTIASYQWTKISGPNSGAINNANSSSATVNNLSEGTYQFEFKVTDDKGAIGKDTVQVKVNEAANISPTVNAGKDQTITLPRNAVTFSAGANDEDGTIASYQWTKISGPNSGAINNANSSSATVNNLSEGTYQFEFKVTDDKGAVSKDTIQVTVNEAANIAPIADAGNNQTIKLPVNSLTLSGTGTDKDGTIASYQWTKISGPSAFTIADQKSATTKISNLSEGTYQFELKVTDNKGAVAKDTVQVKVNEATNIAPTASAGRDQTITLPKSSVTLSGSGTDEDGTVASYQWTKISGPNSGTINNAKSSSATVNNLSEGTYQFELKVSDNKGSVAKDTLQIRVNAANNVAPSANAGSDKTITLPVNSVVLSGTGKDSDGSISGYSWTKISGPSSFSIKNSSSPTSQISELVKGVYQLELKVTDNSGDVAKDTVQVTVMAANVPPTANAGSNQTITLPTNTITLKGSGKDSDGKIAAYLWTKISGPSSFKIEKSGAAVATVSNLAEGIYQFELKVTDNDGANATDIIEVNVKSNSPVTPPAVPVNESPVANAGKDQAITLPINSVTLLGSGKDEDGTIAFYQWTKVSGPNGGTINNANSSSATGNNLSEGTYQFELKVTDNKGGIGKDTVNVKVNEAANIAPVINAGKDTTILYPASAVLLNGQAVDADGEIASYSWKQISGPSESVIKSANTISAEMSALKEGTYEYEFVVTDNKGAVEKDSVKVTVALGRIAPEINTAITVYPNPVHDITTADINTGRANTNVLITVSDMSGKTLYKKQMVSVSDNIKEPINMSNFSKGTYVITIFFDNVMRKSIKVLKL